MSTNAGVAKVIVSPDRLTAWMWVNTRVEPAQLSRERIIQAAEASRIVCSEAVNARLEQLVALLASGTFPEGDFLLVQCRPAGESVDAQFQWDPALSRPSETPEDSTRRVDYHDRHIMISAAAGQVIGRIIPARQGEPGVDVYGNPVAARPATTIVLKGNVELGGDGQTVTAGCDGQVIFDGKQLWMMPVLEIRGDVDFGTGNIDSAGDVIVRGSIKDLFRVQTAKNLVVDGHVEAACLEAGCNITVRGGIHGHEKATVKAGGSVDARLCDEATIEVVDTFSVQKECINSNVRAENKVQCPAGTIIGGHVWGRNGVEVANLGSPAYVRTCASAGVPMHVIEEANRLQVEAKKRQDASGKIREAIAPLVREIRRLSPQHRERTTELMFQADQLDQEVQQMQQKREDLLRQAAPDGEPYVLITGRVHTGTTIIISGRSTTIDQDVRGPVRIVERKIEGVTTLVMVDQLTGSTRILATGRANVEAESEACLAGASVS